MTGRGGAPSALLLSVLLAAALALGTPAAHGTEAERPTIVPGELIVRFAPAVAATGKDRIRDEARTQVVRRLLLPRAQLVRVRGEQTVREAVAELERNPRVDYAEPNFIQPLLATPNDPRFGEQWGHRNTGQLIRSTIGIPGADTDAARAWDTSTGDGGITVAIVDSGVEVDHPDLDDAIWRNPGESGGGKEANGLDDDANSFGTRALVDDFQGWDFVDDDNDPSPGTEPRGDHGTHVAGIVGAEGDNGIGVAGASWDVGVMALRAGTGAGIANADSTDAFIYAIEEGADIVNGSFGGPGTGSVSHRAVIESAPEVLFVFGAGNDDEDNDATPFYPCNHGADGAVNVICVAATDNRDRRSGFSNFGAESVHLGAPGTDILSTLTGGTYGFKNGTSMASPYVAGTAALVAAAHPTASAAEIKGLLLNGVDLNPELDGKAITGGRLDVASSIAIPSDVTRPAAFTLAGPPNSGHVDDATPLLTWNPSSDAGSGLREYELHLRTVGEPSYGLDRDEILPAATSTTPSTPLEDGVSYQWFVRASDKAGNLRNSTFSRSFTVDTTPPTAFELSTPGNGLNTPGAGDATFEWTASSDANLLGYELLIDGVVTHTVGPTVTETTVDLSMVPEGNHNWTVRAHDRAGNQRTSATRSFRVDRTAPTAPVRTAPADGGFVRTDTPTFGWEPSTDAGGSGVGRYVLSIAKPSDPTENQVKEVGAGVLSAQPNQPLSEGEHTWSVIAHDRAGNVRAAAGGRTVVVDTTAPDGFELASPAAGATLEERVPSFAWQESGDDGSGLEEYELVIDGAVAVDAIDPAGSEATVTQPLALGPHTWTVRARDRAGNMTSPVERSFSIVDPVDPPAPAPAEAALERRKVKVSKRGVARLVISCAGSAAAQRCAGRVKLRSARRFGPAGAKRTLRLGRAGLEIGVGRTRKVRVLLPDKGRRKLGKAGKLKAVARLKVTDALGNRSRSMTRVTLKP